MTHEQHTSGPWHVDGMSHHPVVWDANGLVIAYCINNDMLSIRTVDANARLIAAAPELLDAICDALIFVEDAFDDPTTKKQARACSKKVRAAIAKAEGRS